MLFYLFMFDLLSKENFREVDVMYSLGIDDSVFSLCRFPLSLTQQPAKILACGVSVSRLMTRANDNIRLSPKRFPQILTPRADDLV